MIFFKWKKEAKEAMLSATREKKQKVHFLSFFQRQNYGQMPACDGIGNFLAGVYEQYYQLSSPVGYQMDI